MYIYIDYRKTTVPLASTAEMVAKESETNCGCWARNSSSLVAMLASVRGLVTGWLGVGGFRQARFIRIRGGRWRMGKVGRQKNIDAPRQPLALGALLPHRQGPLEPGEESHQGSAVADMGLGGVGRLFVGRLSRIHAFEFFWKVVGVYSRSLYLAHPLQLLLVLDGLG